MTDTAKARGETEGHTIPASRDAALARIAERYLGFETLQTRIGPIDFHEVAVWEAKDALEAAYQAGLDAASSAHDVEPACRSPASNSAAQ